MAFIATLPNIKDRGVELDEHPEASLLKSIQNFADELNGEDDFEAWYFYRNKMHYLNLRQKDPETKSEEI